MPQHPDSYELNPHWTMGGEFAFRGDLPEPQPSSTPAEEMIDNMEDELIRCDMEIGRLSEPWTSRCTHDDGEFTPVGPDRRGDLGTLLVEAIWNHESTATGPSTSIWRGEEQWCVWTGYDSLGRLSVKVLHPDGKITVLAAK